MRRVAFYAQNGHHVAILAPLAEAVGDRLSTLVSTDRHAVVRFDPDVLVVPSFQRLEWFRRTLPGTLIGSVRHGLIAKRGINRLHDRPSARRFDFVCFGDTMSVDRYRDSGAQPTEMWMTGYPQLDPLFRRDRPPDTRLDRDQPTVLYAPTWNPGLSSAPVLGKDVVRWIRGSGPPLNVIIKPHPMIPDESPAWVAWWQIAAAGDQRVRLVHPLADVTNWMLAADILVSDASSTIFEFLALDRPIVLVTNPGAVNDLNYDAHDLAWSWRDVGEEVLAPEALAWAIAAALRDPSARSERRQVYADQLFGEFRDGRNGLRVADRLVDLAARMDAGTAPASLSALVEPRVAGRKPAVARIGPRAAAWCRRVGRRTTRTRGGRIAES